MFLPCGGENFFRLSNKLFVDQQIADGRYGSVSDYMRELIRAEEKQKAQLWLEDKLRECVWFVRE